jgi:hypothetical protein
LDDFYGEPWATIIKVGIVLVTIYNLVTWLLSRNEEKDFNNLKEKAYRSTTEDLEKQISEQDRNTQTIREKTTGETKDTEESHWEDAQKTLFYNIIKNIK